MQKSRCKSVKAVSGEPRNSSKLNNISNRVYNVPADWLNHLYNLSELEGYKVESQND